MQFVYLFEIYFFFSSCYTDHLLLDSPLCLFISLKPTFSPLVTLITYYLIAPYLNAPSHLHSGLLLVSLAKLFFCWGAVTSFLLPCGKEILLTLGCLVAGHG